MSGALVPYHLRVNKAVDRELFFELLRRLDRALPIHQFRYVGFGGPYLEDFKTIYKGLGNRELISLEKDARAHQRQLFNKPIATLDCRLERSGDFVTNYVADKNSIFWLDYTDPKKRRQQLGEFQTLLAKMLRHDVVKISLNASLRTLKSSAQENPFQKLRDQVGDFLADEEPNDEMNESELVSFLCNAIRKCSADAMRARRSENLTLQPLTCFNYVDEHHRMLTLSAVLLAKGEVRQTLRTARISGWSLATTRWGQSKEISVPALTTKERLAIDALLPGATATGLIRGLNQSLGLPPDKARKNAASYATYASFYPHFLRTII